MTAPDHAPAAASDTATDLTPAELTVMLEDVAALVVAWADRGVAVRRSVEILIGSSMRTLAELGASYEEFEPVARAMWARFGAPRVAPEEADNWFTSEVGELVDAWRGRALSRALLEGKIMMSATKRARELVSGV